MNNNVIISCPVTGSGDTATKHPNLPITPKQIAEAAIEASGQINISKNLEDCDFYLLIFHQECVQGSHHLFHMRRVAFSGKIPS